MTHSDATKSVWRPIRPRSSSRPTMKSDTRALRAHGIEMVCRRGGGRIGGESTFSLPARVVVLAPAGITVPAAQGGGGVGGQWRRVPHP